MKLKKLSEQTIVITGATSGIGLATARMAASCGAKLVLAARSEKALRELTSEITGAGGQAVAVVADVGAEDDVERISHKAIEHFGGFDTWVNNAGVSIYGKLMEVSIEDMRRLFETNFWGVVYGSLVAARHLRHMGGALVNVGSTLSDRAIPIQGMYSASKHAVKGFTDALRMELEADGLPISVSLIKPATIDTPYTRHARNYMESEPKNPSPAYSPKVVAEAILHCASNRTRDLFVGSGGKAISLLGHFAPRTMDKVMEKKMVKGQKSKKPSRTGEHQGLNAASGKLEERGDHEGHVSKTSFYTKATAHPLPTAALVVGAAAAATAAFLNKGPRSKRLKWR